MSHGEATGELDATNPFFLLQGYILRGRPCPAPRPQNNWRAQACPRVCLLVLLVPACMSIYRSYEQIWNTNQAVALQASSLATNNSGEQDDDDEHWRKSKGRALQCKAVQGGARDGQTRRSPPTTHHGGQPQLLYPQASVLLQRPWVLEAHVYNAHDALLADDVSVS